MKKLFLPLVLVFAVSAARAGEMEKLKALDLQNVNLESIPSVEIPVPEAVKENDPAVVNQNLEYKFNRVAREVADLRNDVIWLDSDLRQLLNKARRIESSGQEDHFFENDLRRMAYDMNDYANAADRIKMDIRNLQNIAVKSEKLNRIARDMEWDIRDMYNDAQFQIENIARDLLYTVRRIDSQIVGYSAQWHASDIERYARDYTWMVRDLNWDIQDLVRKTQP